MAFIRSMGITRNRPAKGFAFAGKILSQSAAIVLTSEDSSGYNRNDIPAKTFTSNISAISIMLRTSASVPERNRRLRISSVRIAAGEPAFANGRIIFSSSFAPICFTGRITTLLPAPGRSSNRGGTVPKLTPLSGSTRQ